MRVEWCGKSWLVVDIEGLTAALARRDDHNGGKFWLTPDEGWYPALAIRISGDVADVHYFPSDCHPQLPVPRRRQVARGRSDDAGVPSPCGSVLAA